MSVPLYEISKQLQQLHALPISEDLPQEVIRDTIEGLEGDFESKAIAVAKFVLDLEASADAIAAHAEAMKQRALRVRRRSESLRAYLLLQLQMVDRARIDTSQFHIARRSNPPAVLVTEEELVPRQYFVQPEPSPWRIDKIALKRDLSRGAAIPGCHLENSERLEIKI